MGSRLFGYNSGATVSGASQSGSLAISNDFRGGGSVQWWNGPDENLGYVIGYTDTTGLRKANGALIVDNAVGFMRTLTKTDADFLSLSNSLTNQGFMTASAAVNWLNTNGYYTSYSASSVDTDAQAFITAAGITNSTQQTAVNQLVLDLKSYSIWEKYSVIYPFVGGSSSTCSYNLKNPSSYQITFYGGWTFNSNGITSAVNSYGDTGFSPNSGFNSDTDYQYSIYSRTVGNSNDFFTLDVTGCDEYGYMAAIHNLFIRDSNQLLFYDIDGGYITKRYSSTNGSGLYTISRTNSTNYVAYRNGTEMTLDGGTSSNPGSRPVSNVVIAGLSDPCLGISALGTIKNYAFWAMGNGLTSIESSNLYTAVQAFQTTLERQV